MAHFQGWSLQKLRSTAKTAEDNPNNHILKMKGMLRAFECAIQKFVTLLRFREKWQKLNMVGVAGGPDFDKI